MYDSLSLKPPCRDTDSNFTITLYPSNVEDSCESGGKGGITITTETVPRYMTCIDIDKIFGGDESVGFINDDSTYNITYGDHVDPDIPPLGIHWYIPSDSADYDARKNWTNIWFEQRNQTNDGVSEEGENGRWVVTVWPTTNCERSVSSQTPWFKTSCQTSQHGQCESVPYSIKSIGIRPPLPSDFQDCQVWAKAGGAASLEPRVYAVPMAAMAYFIVSRAHLVMF